MALALFDLDNTLLEGDSDFEWGQFLVKKNLVDAEEYAKANLYFYEEYQKCRLDIVEYSAFSFKPLAARSFEELNALHKEFMTTTIHSMVRSQSFKTIEKHHKQGDTVILISATNSFIGKPIADYFGINHLLATDPKIENGRYTTEIEGTPCFQEGKITRLKEWITDNNETLEGSYFYSDSINDLPLLDVVDKPIVVDPDDSLNTIAKERDWPIISLK